MAGLLSKGTRKHMKVSLHLLIALTGLISVLLHILYSPAPFASMTKFTIHANLFITLTFSVSAVTMLFKRTESKLLDFCKNASLIYILVGLLTYHFLLSSGGTYTGPRIITNFTLHYLIPVLVLLNWMMFEEKKSYHYKYVVYWLGFPVLYCAVSLIRGLFDGFYPYFFLNPHGTIPAGVGSYTNVTLFIIGFAFIFSIFGFLLIIINKAILSYKKSS
ncbi:Pr6Pr family membrane protein [Paenibacillus sp. 32O-W]|uniref:Pr6Pr family membrane protein n=2 Tax=unclassified Paenibacillus TaxID=185978 RepID=UPI0011A95357|nr:Pr6Pr family membrane protein [Paenibacillus sp. 32O-W]